MDCHQILSGACNAGDRCFAIGSVEGIPFTAYAAGCNIVILASTFERVQIIPGATHNYIRISAIDCSTDTGKIAAAYEDKVCIFEPTPLIHSDTPPSHGLEYRWVQTATIHAKSHISSLSWNLEGTRLLTGGATIQMWHGRIMHKEDDEISGVKFEIGGDRDPKTPTNEEDLETGWDCVWKCHTATPVHHMAFSPDGTLFATSGKSDRLVKVWYENKQLLFPNKSMDAQQFSSMNSTDHPHHMNIDVNFGFVYIAHPRAVTHISWRKTSKYMPKGSVSNMLVTSCLDNICRIWIETVLPDDGLVNMNQFDPLATQNPKFRTHRHKHRFMQRLKHMKTCFHIRRHAKHHAGAAGMHALGASFGGPGAGTNFGHSPIPSLPSTYSVHDFHSYGYHGTGVTPGLHFHLAASINAETDIPLVPSMHTNDPSNQPNFILHWLNNKEMHFSLQAEAILQDLTRKVLEKEQMQNIYSNGSDHASETAHEANEDMMDKHGVGGGGGGRLPATGRMQKNASHDESVSDGQGSQQHNHPSMSNTTSLNSIGTDHGGLGNVNAANIHGTSGGGGGTGAGGGNGYQLTDSLDMKIECLLRDWHHSPDLLFSIHPIDGSYLIWVVEWLDEYHPGAFRQAQVSFSTRIPSGFPLGDAMSMSTTVSLYNTGGNLLHFKEMVKGVKPPLINVSNSNGQIGGSGVDGLTDLLTPLPSVMEESENEWPGGTGGQSDTDENAPNDNKNELGTSPNVNQSRNSINESVATKNASDHVSTIGVASGSGTSSDLLSSPPSPTISMVTKHSNGTLNLWQLTFADKTKFTQVLSIGHVSRASGHRFRVNDITCHPVLPLLLTTSHHNIPDIPTASVPVPGRLNNPFINPHNLQPSNSFDRKNNRGKDVCVPSGFCSELILWRVDAVGPLSQSGGVSELARINSLEISAFSNVAWIPTLLPSTTLGSLSNSPSACFVASDGECLRIYQAVIDARTLLAEVSSSERRARFLDSMVSLSTECSSDNGYHNQHQPPLHNKIKIVSQQSTARPGCVIQLDAITDAIHDWQNTQFLHVFQEQLITGERTELPPAQALFDMTNSMPSNGIPNTSINTDNNMTATNDIGLTEQQMGAIVDLQRNADFEEPFYIALLERTLNGSTMHMWRIVIASQPQSGLSESVMYVPDSNIVQDLDDPEPGPRHSIAGLHNSTTNNTVPGLCDTNANDVPHIRITTTKVCTQDLPLPDGVDVVHAAPAAGHLSSSSIYPACFAPYIIVTACSDSTSRFWKCKVIKSKENPEDQSLYRYEWCEWDMLSKDYVSNIEINGQPLHISAAYSGRIACAYKYGKSFTRPNKGVDSRYVNLSVAIYECESTGGSEWILEDTIHLKNVHLPRLHLDPHLDLSYLHDNRYLQKKQRLTQVLQTFTTHDENRTLPRNGGGSVGGSGGGSGTVTGGPGSGNVSGDVTPDGLTKTTSLLAVPSFSTLQSLRKSITDHGNTCPLTQKHIVQLDWVSKEDGSHILTVAVGSKILLYTPVSSDLAQANIKAMKESQSTNRPILRKASSLAQPHFNDEIRWMKLRQIELSTADGLPPLPMQMSWVRDGILVVGMDSEMHVYSQWKSNRVNTTPIDVEDLYDTRNLRDEDLRTMAHENSQRRLGNVSSMTHLSRVSSVNLQMLERKKKATAAAATGNSFMTTPLTTTTGSVGISHGIPSSAGINASAATHALPPSTGAIATATTDYMPDYGLFEASRIACPVLPQYHPKQLMELLNSGKIRWVKAILAHLVRCISGTYSRSGMNNSGGGGGGGALGNAGSNGGDEESLNRQRGWSRSRTLSVSYVAGTASPLEQRGSTTQMPEELTLDYSEITSIPPLPLWTLLDADKEMSSGGVPGNQQQVEDAKDLFEPSSDVDQSLDELLDGDDSSETHQRFDRRASVPERQSLSHFGPRQGQLLSRLLTHTHLPGLSSLDQMHLLALADTVATCNTDFSERFAIDAAKTAMAKENLTGVASHETVSTDSLDDCGLRFLLAMKHFTYLLRCLPLAQRSQFQHNGVGTSNLVWAFHSESEEEILHLIPSYGKGEIKWQTLKELGAGWWLRNNSLLRLCIEKLAKAAYQSKQDPLDAAIYYIAMKKKTLVWGLFRTKRDEKMTAFFANDFNEDRWRKAALKNAFALLGKQRFEHAVAFFLLANSLDDAIEVCLNKLHDLQLALIISRLFEGEHDATPPTYKKLLQIHILGYDDECINQDLDRVHPDPFLRSMALWLLKDYSGSLQTLLLNNVGHDHLAYPISEDISSKTDSNQATTNPNVFNFYIYLRTHPLLIRQYIASTAQEKKKAQVVLSGFSYSGGDGPIISAASKKGRTDKQIQIEDSITPLERQLYFTTAHGHFKAGCPALALEVLSKLPTKVIEESTSQMVSPNDGQHDQQIVSGILDWSDDKPKLVNGLTTTIDKTDNMNAGSFDWGAPASSSFDWSQPVDKKNKDDDEFKIEWDNDDGGGNDGDDDDDDIGLGMNIDKKKPTDLEAISLVPISESQSQNNTQRTESLDIMAQQLKFVACLKILMEELSTLATGFEVDGGQLRYQLYVWLEKEVEALRQLCNYSSLADPVDSSMDESTNVHDMGGQLDRETTIPINIKSFEKPTLHEILMQEKQDFEAKVQRAARRKRWLKANETLLRTLLSYCSLHGASGGGLASVRMELVLLLQELQQEKTQQQLLSPLPFPTTLPLLSACVAGNKTVIADPIKYLQSHTQDMLQTIVDLRQPPIGLKISTASEIFVLRDLAVALSACIYQSLCDSDTFIVKQVSEISGYQSPGMETLARLNASCQSSHLMANAGAHQRRRKYSSDEPVTVSTSPSKWPGVTNLRALLAREKDEDIPRLNILLCEAFMATFMSLLVYALATCDCHILYRFAGQKFTNATWANLFGGGVKKLLRKATSQLQSMSQQQSSIQIDNYQAVVAGESTPDSPMTDANSVWTAVTSLTKQRVKLNMKLLGNFSGPTGSPNMKEDKPTYREQFVSPDMSMVSYFLIKPNIYNHDPDDDDYDSADSISSDVDDENDDEDVFADPLNNDPKVSQVSAALKKHRMENTEHSNPNSYAWVIMRLAVMRLAQHQLQEFINIAGIEIQELPVASPLIHGILRTLSAWQDLIKDELLSRGPAPPDFIPGCFVESDAKGPAIHKYRSLLEKHNTPFSPIKGSAAPARRLWNYLVRQELVQDIFIRAIFGKKRPSKMLNTLDNGGFGSMAPSISGGIGGGGGGNTIGGVSSTGINELGSPTGGGSAVDGYSSYNQNIHMPEPVRIIHKEQESISAFCLNFVNPGMLTLATPREAQEMDISLLLESPNWLEDECELDIMNLNKDIDTLAASSFLLIQASSDKSATHQNVHSVQSYGTPSSPQQQGIAGQSGRGASVIKGATFPGSHDPRYCKLIIDRSKHLLKPVLKHKVDNIKRMCAHPLMPLYLTGGQDGSVQMWEWGHQQVVCTPRPPGTFAKVTRCRFSQHGNKFGIADGDGNLSLWQAGLASQCNRSFFTFPCHNKGITDFVFLGSCSLVATAGHSSESKNVGMWDTLLPQKKSLVASFTCHDQGASSLVYAPQHQLLISAGKKGDVYIFDVRQRQLRHRFQAHESAIKCLAIDPHEEHFVTGSADGDIKVWGLTVHTSLYSFPGEHARNSFFKHIGQGVTQLQVDNNGRLFSCGADGSMKVRQLPDRESIIHSLY